MNRYTNPLLLSIILSTVLFAASCGKEATNAEASSTKYTCGMHPQVVRDEPGNCPICGMRLTPMKNSGDATASQSGERKIKYWRAPMNPTEIYDKPGKSAMGMDLVPVYESDAGMQGAVRIDPSVQQNINLKTDTVRRRNLSAIIRTSGHLDYNEKLVYEVNAKITGWVEKLYVNFTGKYVRAGDPLLDIYSPDLVSAQEEYLSAMDYRKSVSSSGNQQLEQSASRLLESSKRRFQYWDIPDEEIRALENTREVKKVLTLRATQSGYVIDKRIVEGARIMAGQALMKIADLSTIWLHADLYEFEISEIREGNPAIMTVPAYPGKEYSGRVTFLYPFLDAKARTMRVRMEFSNPETRLKPEMFANVTIDAGIAKDVLTVPEQSVIRSGVRNIVIVALGDGLFSPKEVVLGKPAGGFYQILGGLEEGEAIVTSAQFLIDSESNLNAAIAQMSSSESEPDMPAHQH